jgi:peptidoglycan/xylan/chitin deacetylase (PgdA/CDA1 family)
MPNPVILTPPTPYTVTWEQGALVVKPDRLEAGTTYEVQVSPALEGQNGAPIEPSPVVRFTVRPAPRATVELEQDPLALNGAIRIAFDQAMDTAEVERGFRLEPAALGRSEWPDPQTLVFRPDHLRLRTEYRLLVSGTSQLGDELAPVEHHFQTADLPPLSLPAGMCGNLYSLGPQFTLTFDDWGTVEQTDGILRALADAQVRAVFFPVGWWAQQNPDLIARMRAEGHTVGNHTYSHAWLTRLSAGRAQWEIASGVAGSGLFRPPFGARNAYIDSLACRLGYRTVLWTVDPSDYLCQPADMVADKVIAAARPGGIAVLHIKGCSTAQALPRMLLGLRARGLL